MSQYVQQLGSPPQGKADPKPKTIRSLGRPLLLFLSVVLMFSVAGVALLAWPKGDMTSLVGMQDWHIEGQFFDMPHPTGLELPDQILASPELRLWRSWSPTLGGTSGHIVSAPFNAHAYLAIPFLGLPGEVAGNTIGLRCTTDDTMLPVANIRTNGQWSTAYLHVPKSFCRGPLQLEANAAGGRMIMGVGTPYKISAAAYYAAGTFPTRALAVTLTWAWFAALIAVCGIGSKLAFRRVDALSAGFTAMGVLGLIAFFIYHFSPDAGTISTSIFAAFVPIAAAALYRFRPEAARDFIRNDGPAFLLWLVVAWAYIAFISAIDNGGGSWAVNGAFSPLRWSSDNQLPFLFAEGMYDGTPREQIVWGQWLASDRPPLLSGLLLLVRYPLIDTLGSFVSREFVGTLYVLVSATLLTSWVLPTYRFGETVQRGGGVWLTVLAALCPFFLFNSVYIWPKLLGASYGLFVLLQLSSAQAAPRRSALILAGACAALSLLSHTSNAMIFPVMGLIFARTIVRQGAVTLLIAATVAVGVLAPWMAWQEYVQPDANALLRYALTNDFGLADRTRPILPGIIKAYRSLGLGGWLSLKFNGLLVMLGLPSPASFRYEVANYGPGVGFIGNLRVWDFFSVIRGLGVTLAGLLLLPITRPARALSAQAAICGIGGIAITALLFLPTPVTHQLPYAGVAALFLAAASMFLGYPKLRVSILTLEAAYFLVVWIVHPLSIALRIDPSALLASIAALVTLFSFVSPRQARLMDR